MEKKYVRLQEGKGQNNKQKVPLTKVLSINLPIKRKEKKTQRYFPDFLSNSNTGEKRVISKINDIHLPTREIFHFHLSS